MIMKLRHNRRNKPPLLAHSAPARMAKKIGSSSLDLPSGLS